MIFCIELPDLLAVLSVRLGPIDHVTYNFADWAAAPTKFPTGGDTVRLSGFYQQQKATPSKSSASIAPSSFCWWYRVAPNQNTRTRS